MATGRCDALADPLLSSCRARVGNEGGSSLMVGCRKRERAGRWCRIRVKHPLLVPISNRTGRRRDHGGRDRIDRLHTVGGRIGLELREVNKLLHGPL